MTPSGSTLSPDVLTVAYDNTAADLVVIPGAVDLAVVAWLQAKGGRSGSAKTIRAYSDALHGFRRVLQERDLDLDADPRAVALLAQEWAARGDPAPATVNQRASPSSQAGTPSPSGRDYSPPPTRHARGAPTGDQLRRGACAALLYRQTAVTGH